MANIRVDVNSTIKDGSEIVFIAPCDCSEITKLNVYYPDKDGNNTNSSFIFKDAHGNELFDVDLFAKGAYVKVILNVTEGIAYIQNADTNKYLEGEFEEVRSAIDEINKIDVYVKEINISTAICEYAFKSIAYGEGVYVGITNDGVYYSTDAIEWELVYEATYLQQVIYGNSEFICIGSIGGNIYYSYDGKKWEQKVYPLNPDASNTFITYDEIRHLFFVSNSNNEIYGAYSGGSSWDLDTTLDFHINNIICGKGKIVVPNGDTIYCDGTTYPIGIDGEQFYNITYGNGIFVMCSINNVMAYSLDAIHWTKGQTMYSRLLFFGYGNDTFVAIGNTNSIYYSYDGKKWEYKDEVDAQYNCFCYDVDNNKFVGVSNSDKSICHITLQKAEKRELHNAIHEHTGDTDNPHKVTASQVKYDDAESELSTLTVQSAIDKLVSNGKWKVLCQDETFYADLPEQYSELLVIVNCVGMRQDLMILVDEVERVLPSSIRRYWSMISSFNSSTEATTMTLASGIVEVYNNGSTPAIRISSCQRAKVDLSSSKITMTDFLDNVRLDVYYR